MNIKYDLDLIKGMFYSPKKDLIRDFSFALSTSFMGYLVGDLYSTVAGFTSGYLFSHFNGPFISTQKDYFKHYFKDEFKPLSNWRKFSKNSLFTSLGMLSLSSFIMFKNASFSFDNLELIINEDKNKFILDSAFKLTSALVVGYSFGDYFPYLFSRSKEVNFSFSNLFNPDFEKISQAALAGDVSSLELITRYHFRNDDVDLALATFVNSVYVNNYRDSFLLNGFDISRALYLEKQKKTKELLVYSLISDFPKEFTDGLVDKLITKATNENDTSLLGLLGLYLEKNNSPNSSKVWSDVGLQISKNKDSLEKKVFSHSSSTIYSLNLTNNPLDVVNSSLLQKVFPKDYSQENISDEVKLSNFIFDELKDDDSLDSPLVLNSGVLEDNPYILLRLIYSNLLLNELKNNPSNFDNIYSFFIIQSDKIKKLYQKASDLGIVTFNPIDYENRISNQKEFFNSHFDSSLAKSLIDNINSSSHVDSVVPGTDNHPSQWLFNQKLKKFTRLDLSNNGLRNSIEDFVNPTLFIDESFPKDLLKKSIDMQLAHFCSINNLDLDVVAPYFLDASFERRNHLMTLLSSRPHSKHLIPNLLDCSNTTIEHLGSFSKSKSYVSSQFDQNNSFYNFYTSNLRI